MELPNFKTEKEALDFATMMSKRNPSIEFFVIYFPIPDPDNAYGVIFKDEIEINTDVLYCLKNGVIQWDNV